MHGINNITILQWPKKAKPKRGISGVSPLNYENKIQKPSWDQRHNQFVWANKRRNLRAGFRVSRLSILRRRCRILHRERISNAMADLPLPSISRVPRTRYPRESGQPSTYLARKEAL